MYYGSGKGTLASYGYHGRLADHPCHHAADTRAPSCRSADSEPSQPVVHPDVWLEVAPSVPRPLDRHCGKPTREPVVTTVGEREPDPVFPFGHRRRDPERPSLGFENTGSESLVNSHPRIEQRTVWSSPRRIALDRCKRVTLLGTRSHWRDEGPEAVAPRDVRHRHKGARAHASSLHVTRNCDQECAECVGLLLIETTGERTVDPWRKTLYRPVAATFMRYSTRGDHEPIMTDRLADC